MRAATAIRCWRWCAGSAINQDGASNGLTAPNGPAQQRVIRAALASAGVRPAEVDVVEAHGTGTELGDPIEAQALLATYGQGRAAGRPLWLGSVKSNIGHTQAAAGVAGVIKMVLALRHGLLPPTLHVERAVAACGLVVRVGVAADRADGLAADGAAAPRRDLGVRDQRHERARHPGAIRAWDSRPGAARPAEACRRRPAAADAVVPVVPGGGVVPWVVSGRSAAGLAAQAGRLAAWAAASPWTRPMRAAAGGTRSVFEYRAVVLGTGRAGLLAGLAALAAGKPGDVVTRGRSRRAGRAGWSSCSRARAPVGGDGRGAGPVLAGVRGAACRLRRRAGPIRGLVAARGAGRGGRRARAGVADIVQPALWAVMVSLAAVWQAAGVSPDAVVGHSQGEIAAATVAGILSLDDAARVVALRSRALSGLAGTGGMVSVVMPEAAVASCWPAGPGGCRSRRSTARPRPWSPATPPRWASSRPSCRPGTCCAGPSRPATSSPTRPRSSPSPRYSARTGRHHPRGRAGPVLSTVTGQWATAPPWTPPTGTPTCAAPSGSPTPCGPWPAKATARSSRSPPTPC